MWEKVKDKEGKAKQRGRVKCHSQSSSEIMVKTFSSHFLYFQCVFPHAEMRYCWLTMKRERAALAHCYGKVPFPIDPSLRSWGQFVPLRSKHHIQASPSSPAETPGAAGPCAGPGAPTPERNGSNAVVPPWLAAKVLIIIAQGKDQLARGWFLCTAKELSAAEVSWIPGRAANPAGSEGCPHLPSWESPPLSA